MQLQFPSASNSPLRESADVEQKRLDAIDNLNSLLASGPLSEKKLRETVQRIFDHFLELEESTVTLLKKQLEKEKSLDSNSNQFAAICNATEALYQESRHLAHTASKFFERVHSNRNISQELRATSLHHQGKLFLSFAKMKLEYLEHLLIHISKTVPSFSRSLLSNFHSQIEEQRESFEDLVRTPLPSKEKTMYSDVKTLQTSIDRAVLDQKRRNALAEALQLPQTSSKTSYRELFQTFKNSLQEIDKILEKKRLHPTSSERTRLLSQMEELFQQKQFCFDCIDQLFDKLLYTLYYRIIRNNHSENDLLLELSSLYRETQTLYDLFVCLFDDLTSNLSPDDPKKKQLEKEKSKTLAHFIDLSTKRQHILFSLACCDKEPDDPSVFDSLNLLLSQKREASELLLLASQESLSSYGERRLQNLSLNQLLNWSKISEKFPEITEMESPVGSPKKSGQLIASNL